MRILTILLVLFLSAFSFSQNSYRFRNYTISDGLSQSAISTLIQDNVGSIWIGTQDGLNRFDGQTFETFMPDNSEGLENGDILSSIKTSNGILWFGTSNGLTQYNPYTENFKTFLVPNLDVLQAKSIVADKHENIWIGSYNAGLLFFDAKTKKITRLKNVKLSTEKILFITLLTNDELLISTEDKGIFVYHIPQQKVYPLQAKAKTDKEFRAFSIKPFDHDDWIICTNQGLYFLNKFSKKIRPCLRKLDDTYGWLEIHDILILNEHKFIITSKSDGLFTIEHDKNKNKVNIYQSTQDIFQKHALLYNATNVLLRDKNGTYWVGTERGLCSFDPINQGFLGNGPSEDLSKGIPAASVWSFCEDNSTRYCFIGSDNSVSRFDNNTGKFSQYFKQIKIDKKINNSIILSMKALSANQVLVGAGDGLHILKINGENNYSFTKIPFRGISNASSFERIYEIEHWKDSKYFLATKGGVLLYDQKAGTFKAFEHDEENPWNTIGGGVCKVIFKDKDNHYWFTAGTGGLFQLVEKEDGELFIKPYKYNNRIASLSKEYIASMYQEDENTLWLGTMGAGLLKWNLKTKKGKLFNKKSGLPNNVVYAILNENNSNNIWISTNKGISKFNTKTEEVLNFTEQDGLMSNEFNQGAYFKSKTGKLYFGGIYGYNYFDPHNLSTKEKMADVNFTKIKLDDHWLKPQESNHLLKTAISYSKHILLPYKKRSVTLKFMATELSNPNLISYKYVLEGSDEDEVLLGNTNQLHLNSIQPGEYVLKVYARFANGPWSEKPATLSITVETPYWKTIWFWIGIAMVIALLTIFYFRKKIEYERRQQVKLEMKIAERTREIREQNVKIEKQKEMIEEKKNNLEEQKKLLEIEKEKTEKVLKNILPVSTYEEIKATGRASARAYNRVSVLFTDFVGFTKIAETMSPSQLVDELDIYFRKFDEIIVRNNLEKIKTIGDAYMCAGGVPVRNETNPIDACLAALQIQDTMQQMREKAIAEGGQVWNLRLGINTGEVTAGVIGTEKLAYDIWGSTVNQAQRMEMLGEPGKVNVSGQTFKFIEPYFICTFRGKAKTKSQGLIDMYTVEGIKPELSIDGKGLYPNERFHQIINLHQYSSINYYNAERHIMQVLEEQLSPKLHYHSILHTADVVKSIERIALLEGVTDEGLFLLKSAASYHDAGFIEAYDNNEPIGARLAEEILPNYGYSIEHINIIKDLIYVTAIPHKPKNHLEEIICDADLDYLGREDFHEIADKLRVELREYDKINSDRKWDEIQVAFLTNHRYFTQTAINTRNERKAKHLQEIKERLEKNNYPD
jgi:ligand-binding sensor domain-containing protein/class 3 adenylate cyclase/predicted metal-dependent HD superfamily phosphohydrolase